MDNILQFRIYTECRRRRPLGHCRLRVNRYRARGRGNAAATRQGDTVNEYPALRRRAADGNRIRCPGRRNPSRKSARRANPRCAHRSMGDRHKGRIHAQRRRGRCRRGYIDRRYGNRARSVHTATAPRQRDAVVERAQFSGRAADNDPVRGPQRRNPTWKACRHPDPRRTRRHVPKLRQRRVYAQRR